MRRPWWVWRLLGLASTLLGAAPWALPEATLEALVTLIGAYVLAAGFGYPRQRDAGGTTLEFAMRLSETAAGWPHGWPPAACHFTRMRPNLGPLCSGAVLTSPPGPMRALGLSVPRVFGGGPLTRPSQDERVGQPSRENVQWGWQSNRAARGARL